MEAALEAARAKDTKQRLAGVERLHEALEAAARRGLTSAEVTSLVDACMDLTKDGNFRVAQGGLQALSAAAVLAGDHFKIHLNALVPAAVERLGDGKQPVRDAARQLLVTLMEVSSPTIIVERAGSYAWTHKSWRVREEFVRTVATAVGLFASTELPLQRVLLSPVLQLLNDLNQSVRDAAISCIEEMYRNMGSQFHEELQRHNLPSYMLKDINSRLDKIEPKARSSDGARMQYKVIERSVSANPKRGSPRKKSDSDITEKPVEPIRVHSEKELLREMEKIASALDPEKDWSIRIAAMQRIEALVYGGAIDYPSFLTLLKQLVPPLSAQLSDRRSSIVKQACHLLNMLSKELLGDFEACAEIFIPILRNCKVSRILPLIADTAKNDRSAILRARCSEYALLILEYWADAPEIQRASDIYEDLIKCCVADAMSEVRATARSCYRMFTKTWPERSRRLFMSFDPAVQRIINDEDGGLQKRYPSPSLCEKGVQLSRASSHASGTHLAGYSTSAIVAMDKSAAISSESSLSSRSLLSQSKTIGRTAERSIESVLSSSKQKVSAIESLLKGVSGRQNFSAMRSTSLDLGVDPPSSRDPPIPLAATASDHLSLQNSILLDSSLPSINNTRNGGSRLVDTVNPHVANKERSRIVTALCEKLFWEKGIQEVMQNFEKVMKLFFRYLDDPHHKVAQAAFSTLADIIPACKKQFESYVERILPYVFSRLIDPKELVRQPCSSTLEVVGRTYPIDTLLPALVRSLDEQRSPKAKLAVLEFANKSFSRYKVDSEGYSNSGFLKLWLSKLAPLIHEKNAKLKETSISGIIAVYSHFDSTAVLNFILNLSIEEQNLVRRALKQYTPRIEVDLVNYLQSKKERSRPKSYDQVDFGNSSEDGYALTPKSSYAFGRFSASSLDNASGKKMNMVHGSTFLDISTGRTSSDVSIDNVKQCFEPEAEVLATSRESKNIARTVVEAARSWTDYPGKSDATIDDENSTGTPRLEFGHLAVSDGRGAVISTSVEDAQEGNPLVELSSVKITPHTSNGPSIPQLIRQISNVSEVTSLDKREALQQLVTASTNNDNSIWTKYFNQILTTILEVLDDSDSSIRELSLSLVAEMLHNQKDPMEESIEIVLEKLLHVTKDVVAKVSNEANQCLNVVLAKYDPFRCLAVIVPLLVSDDEKMLVVCTNCLTKLVGRLSEEELMTQLPSFLPALFDAFNNQSPDVRKTVVFCLVDIYIMLGKAFVPYLEGLNSTQLRLVTIYANRISQARSGAPIDANH
uniref:TOG domain-containing protein n=1 Tax=Oryza glumipatula TaxID=40148 RepID=A0A0D9YUZ9_9ORYZ